MLNKNALIGERLAAFTIKFSTKKLLGDNKTLVYTIFDPYYTELYIRPKLLFQTNRGFYIEE